jgi:hypothetical protein
VHNPLPPRIGLVRDFFLGRMKTRKHVETVAKRFSRRNALKSALPEALSASKSAFQDALCGSCSGAC